MPTAPAQALDALERLADRVQIVTTRQVERRPSLRAEIVAALLWNSDDGGAVTTARNAGAALVDRVVGAPGPPAVSLEEYHDAAFQQRLADLRARGEQLTFLNGRWMRPSYSTKQTWTPVETPRELVQQRVYRGDRDAYAKALLLAKRLGIPPRKEIDGREQWSDPRLEAHYNRVAAVNAGRVAHDVTVDGFRDAVLEQAESRPEVIGWKRLAEPTACGACLALANGRLEPASERRFYRHGRCRCVPVPVTLTSPPIPTGRQMFDALSEDEQDRVFRGRGGRRKAQALRDGTISLDDLVTVDEDRIGRTDYVVSETPSRDLDLPLPARAGALTT